MKNLSKAHNLSIFFNFSHYSSQIYSYKFLNDFKDLSNIISLFTETTTTIIYIRLIVLNILNKGY